LLHRWRSRHLNLQGFIYFLDQPSSISFLTFYLALFTGYPIEELAEKSTFLEVAYLLIYGELPTEIQAKEWNTQIMRHTFIHFQMSQLMKSFHYDAHPMGMFIRFDSIDLLILLPLILNKSNKKCHGWNVNLSSGGQPFSDCISLPPPFFFLAVLFSSLFFFFHFKSNDIYSKDEKVRNQQIFRILGKAATVAACSYRHRIGRS